MASQIFKWVRWTLGALFAAIMVFVMAGTGVMFIVTDGSWLAVTLMFLIVHTMNHK